MIPNQSELAEHLLINLKLNCQMFIPYFIINIKMLINLIFDVDLLQASVYSKRWSKYAFSTFFVMKS